MNNDKIATIASSNGSSGETDFESNLKKDDAKEKFSDISFQDVKETSPRRRRVEVFLTVQDGLKNYGKQRGDDSGDVEPIPATEASLRAFARASAEDAFREAFNLVDSLHDRSLHEEFEKDRTEIVDASHALLNEKSKLKDGESLALKEKARVPAEPEFPIALVVVGVPLITLTVDFALFDSFVSSLGFILALTFSLLAGLCWGAFICYLILHKYHNKEGERDWMNWFGLIAGIGMALALGLIRLNQSSAEFLWLVLGLTLLEIFIVIGLEFFARHYRHALLDHSARTSAADEAQGNVDAIKAEIHRRQERVDELQGNIDDHLLYLDERELRAKQRDQMVAAAETAVIDGYRGAVAKNKGMQFE